MDAMTYSTNERADALMGRRPEGVIPFDQPYELGYWCPVCRVPALTEDGEAFDERLHWSEYNGFLWCEVCDRDYPSALCVPLELVPDPREPWKHAAGVEAAIDTFLSTVQQAVDRATTSRDSNPSDVG